MTPKKYYSWNDTAQMVSDICQQIAQTDWRPDYVVGITRGGNLPCKMISHYFDVPGESLTIKLRDGGENNIESNCWMSEDAAMGKNILIVDDINDTGATFNWIHEDWKLHLCKHQVRFATLTENLASEFGKVSYYAHEVNKAEEDVWLVYPWEDVGEYYGV